ncbi:MAG TPA: YdeI/OmpD-associated family protein, partial [Kutzneria sp.]|nr:YdeI/OmpD-associated family protein [Kutzneria sp.]
VEVDVTLDTAPREVEVPKDLEDALAADPEAHKIFDGLPFTHRKEYVRWIEEAKKPETRVNRVAKTLEKLRA